MNVAKAAIDDDRYRLRGVNTDSLRTVLVRRLYRRPQNSRKDLLNKGKLLIDRSVYFSRVTSRTKAIIISEIYEPVRIKKQAIIDLA